MLTYLLFIIGFVFLIKGASFLIDGASALARKLSVSDLIIGLTVVAFGTSAPELLVNVYASFQGNAEIALGNIMGSNIANILLILGISAIIYPLVCTSEVVYKQIPLTLLAAVVLGILVNDTLIYNAEFSTISRWDGLILLILFAIFMYHVVRRAKRQRSETREIETGCMNLKKASFGIIIGLVGLNLGAKWVVDGAASLAEALGASEMLIGLTIVALGTSLPELVTSVTAAYRKNSDIAVGNIIGSNIFNTFFILGISSTIRPIPFNSETNVDICIMIISSLLLFIAMFTGRKRNLLDRREGIVFLALYAGYIAYSILRG